METKRRLPIVYSCSGCSSAAQMANWIAIQLDRQGLAEMSCIAGVGGDVPSLVKTAQSGREIIVLDGCPLVCSQHCLARHNVKPDQHFLLSDMKVPKKIHQDFDPKMAEEVLEKIKAQLKQAQALEPTSV